MDATVFIAVNLALVLNTYGLMPHDGCEMLQYGKQQSCAKLLFCRPQGYFNEERGPKFSKECLWTVYKI